jgi:tRNA splicing ligase
MKLPADFIKFIQENPKLITRKESVRYPGLFVIKYTRKCFYDGIWNKYLKEARGLVVDSDWNPVIQPFTKIFNRGENGTDIDRDTTVTSIRKVNGFMAGATYVDGHGVIVSTTGSLDSDFVVLAEKYITPEVKTVIERYAPAMTFVFEIVDATDPHIVVEEEGAYLIGARVVPATKDYMSDAAWESFLDDSAVSLGVKRPDWTVSRFSDVVETAKTCKHEGFVVYSETTALKIKSPFYLTSKFFARKGAEKLFDMLSKNATVDSIKQDIIDEEYFHLVDHLVANKEEFCALGELARLDYIKNFLA